MGKATFYSLVLIFIVSIGCNAQIHDPRALAADPRQATTALAPKLEGLGNLHFPVTTSDPNSQYFFNQGFRLFLGFNHSEALRSFKEAARIDPNNAMAYWGWALVLGPNLNLPMQDYVTDQANEAVAMAIALKDKVSIQERDYIEALAHRYSTNPETNRASLNASYADHMKSLTHKYPDDLNAAVLYVAAVMNTNPWDYWYRDGSPKPQTTEILDILNSVIRRDPWNAGAHHYLIHLVEAFRPELGVKSADILGGLMPGAGHLVHMPSHIYMRVGRYRDSAIANNAAIIADKSYITQCQAQGLYPLGYYPHNIHFLAWSSMFLGNKAGALAAARQVEDKIDANVTVNTWGLNETFRSQPMFVLVRFGDWKAMLDEPRPDAAARFMTGVWHYGRGLAKLHLKGIKAAEQELMILKSIRNDVAQNLDYRVAFSTARDLLTIAEKILMAEIAGKKGQYHRAIMALDHAVRLEDSQLYNEPPAWYFPVRHILGAMLLDAGRASEAEVVFWQDLKRNPENGYSLFGLSQALKAQGKTATADVIDKRLKTAWKYADVDLSSARY